jgi:thiamine monophosphate synthase
MNARACLDAGAVGIAAIRLFQQGEVAKTIERLRELVEARL